MNMDLKIGEGIAKSLNETGYPAGVTCCRKHWADANGNRHAVGRDDVLWNPIGMPFILCKTCGNKRCPKATDCALDCTNSNEPGQAGSIYG